MEHGEEINHAYIVAPFSCWRLDIPESLYIFASQGAVFFIVAVSQCKCSHGIGSGHSFSVVACWFRTIKIKLSALESLGLEELEQPPHHCALAIFGLTREIIVHTDVHRASDGIILVAVCMIAEVRTAIGFSVEEAVVRIEAGLSVL